MTAAPTDARPSKNRTRTYVLVLLLEAVTIAALWTFGHHFGSL